MALFLLFRSSGELCDRSLRYETKLPLDKRVAAAFPNLQHSIKQTFYILQEETHACVSYRVLHAVSYSIPLETVIKSCVHVYTEFGIGFFFNFSGSFHNKICSFFWDNINRFTVLFNVLGLRWSPTKRVPVMKDFFVTPDIF